MIKQLRHWIATAAIAVGLVSGFALLAPAPAYADLSTDEAKNSACEAIGGDNTSGECSTGGPSLQSVLSTVINLLSIAVGLAAVIMIMVGGFKYVTASGDSNKLTSAKNTIVYAVVGLVVVAFAQAIVRFVINKTA